MRIKDMRPGQKLYHTQPAKYVADSKQPPAFETIYIMDVDRGRSMVNDAINGSPARWFENGRYKNWTTEKPQQLLQ